MSVLADRIRSLSAEVLKNTRSLNLNNIRGSRSIPLRISHPSGANLEFKNGKVYYNGSELISTGSNPPGTNATSFTIDMDNEGAGVDTYLCFNRGSSGEDAVLKWDESDQTFEVWYDGDTQSTLADLDCAVLGCEQVVCLHVKTNIISRDTVGDLVIDDNVDMNSHSIKHCNSIAAQGMPINIYNGASIFGDVELNNHDLTEVKTISGYGSILYLGTNVVCDYKEIRFGADGSSSYIAEDSGSHDLVLESTNGKIRFDSDIELNTDKTFYIDTGDSSDVFKLFYIDASNFGALKYEKGEAEALINFSSTELQIYQQMGGGEYSFVDLYYGHVEIRAHDWTKFDCNDVKFDCDWVVPYTTNPDTNARLGASNYRWRAGYFKDLYYSGTLSHSDLYFDDLYCVKCGRAFEDGDDLVLKVLSTDGLLATVPIHKECAEAPKVKRTIKTKKIVKVEETFNGERVVRYTTETKKDGDKIVDVYIEREIEL